MKKTLIATLAVLAATFATAQTKMNAKDSASYAVGTKFTEMFKSLDSTLNIELIIQGLRENTAGNAIMSRDEAEEAIQNFVQIKQQQQYILEMKEADRLAVEATQFMDSIALLPGVSKTASGLLYEIEQMGSSRLPQEGDMVTVHYTLWLADGTKLDSSYDRGEPMTYANEAGRMIAGFTEGLQLLGEGGKATLYIPPSLGYGDSLNGAVGPNQVLIFDVSLLAITPAQTVSPTEQRRQKKDRP